MLGPYGETLLLDWGLAKALTVEEDKTAPPSAVPATRAAS
jgi:hypothetical protein